MYEFADVFQFARFYRVELDAELSFHGEQQANVSQAVPSIDVTGGEIGTQHDTVVVEDIMENLD